MLQLRTVVPLLLVGSVVCPAGATPVTQVPKPADGVVDSIGVCTHLRYSDTPYNNYAQVKSTLQNLGIRHVRDGLEDLSVPGEATAESRFSDLAANGIKSTLIFSPGTVPASDTYATGLAAAFNRLGPGVIEMVEGPNEADQGFNWIGKTFPQSLIDFQNTLWNRLRTAGITVPIIAPSMGNPLQSPLVTGMSYVSNYGNTHSYQGARYPEYIDPSGSGFASGTSGLGMTTFYLPFAQQEMSGSGSSTYPIICTETGNPTTPIPPGYVPSGSQPWAGTDTSLWMPNITPAAQSRYVLRTYLHNFNLGVVRTFNYELVDERSATNPNLQAGKDEGNFGLYYCNASAPTTGNFSIKPAGQALKSMISLLADPGGAFTPTPLTYDLTGATTNIESILLQKRDGSYWLVLWQKVRSYDEYNLTNLTVPDASVSLTLPGHNFDVKAMMPYHSNTLSSPAWSLNNVSQVNVPVPDHPILLRLVLRASALRPSGAFAKNSASQTAVPFPLT